MTRIKLFIVVLATALLALAASPATESASGSPEARQWQVKNSETVKAGVEYELHNTRRRQLDLSSQVGLKKTSVFLGKDVEDLGWVGSRGGHFEFRRANPRDHRSISPDETLALYNTKNGKYLVYRAGLAIHDFNSSPSYEWMVLDREGADFALYNTKIRDYLVLGVRFKGANNHSLAWLKSLSQ